MDGRYPQSCSDLSAFIFPSWLRQGQQSHAVAKGRGTNPLDQGHGEGGFWHSNSLLPMLPILLRGAHSLPATPVITIVNHSHSPLKVQFQADS